jgi:hypothetical protein
MMSYGKIYAVCRETSPRYHASLKTWGSGEDYFDKYLCMPTSLNKTDNNIDLDSLEFVQAINSVKQNSSKHIVNSDILIYPNPASSQITVKYFKNNKGQFVLFDILGKEVLRVDLDLGERVVTFDVSELSNGIYSYNIHFEDESKINGKLYIQKL